LSAITFSGMSGAKVRWRSAEEHFEVVDHGVLWADDDTSIIGAALWISLRDDGQPRAPAAPRP